MVDLMYRHLTFYWFEGGKGREVGSTVEGRGRSQLPWQYNTGRELLHTAGTTRHWHDVVVGSQETAQHQQRIS